ncbi:MAG TPA: hypothetical protein VGE97_03825, partial [Nitrososphaera sp.]
MPAHSFAPRKTTEAPGPVIPSTAAPTAAPLTFNPPQLPRPNVSSIINSTLSYLNPWGSACDLQYQQGSNCIDPDGVGIEQVGDGQFNRISSLAIFPPNSTLYDTNVTNSGPELNSTFIFAVDMGNDRIEKFFINGTFVLKWGSTGTFDGAFFRPSAIAVDNKTVYVGDSSGRIQVFDTNGTFLYKWGSLGSLDQQFLNISGIALLEAPYANESSMTVAGADMGLSPYDSYNQTVPGKNTSILFVLDSDNNRIQEFYTNGTYIRKFGTTGQQEGQLINPSAIAISPSEKSIYVADAGNNRIQVFFLNGTFANMWNLTNPLPTLSPIRATGLSALGDRLLITDSANKKILEYLLNGTFVEDWELEGISPATLSLLNNDPLSISNSGSKFGFIAIGYGFKNLVGIYLVPVGANAGEDVKALPGETIILNGSNSNSPKPGSQIIQYSWRQIIPSANGTMRAPLGNATIVPINDANKEIAYFTVPPLLNDTEFIFELNTLDSSGYNSSDLMRVNVSLPALTPQMPQLIQQPPSLAGVPNTSPKYDPFGVLEVYPTKISGEEWFMDMNNPGGDRRFDPQEPITKNADGSWKMRATQVRMGVFPSTGYNPSAIVSKTESDLQTKGYMQGVNDWKNVEMTGYVKFNAGSEDNFAWYARGGRHTGSGPMEGCEGVAYKGDLYYSGKAHIAKEQWHVSYDYSPEKQVLDSIQGRWVGFKFVIFNTVLPDGKNGVKMEIWVDPNSNQQWAKVYEYIDSGGWGREGTNCGGSPDQIISWGGPIATFRWDGATDVDFKFMSVREINGQAGPTGVPTGGSVSAPFPMGPPNGTDGGMNMGGGQKEGESEKPGTSTNQEVAIHGKNVHVIWQETVDGNSEILYKRSLDGGNTYQEEINLSNSSQDSFEPKIKVWEDNKIGVVYRENNDIYYTSSDNNGESFTKPVNLSNNPETLSSDPTIDLVDGSQIKIAWVEHDAKVDANEAKNQPTTGMGSTTNTNLPSHREIDPQITQIDYSPSTVQVSTNNVTRQEMVDSAVMISKSMDGGKTFSSPTVVTYAKDSEIHSLEMGTTSNGKTHLCYVKGSEDNTDIYCSHSATDGTTFGNSTNVTLDPSSPSLTPKLAVANDSMQLVWSDLKGGAGGNLDVFAMSATGENDTFGERKNLSNDTAGSTSPDVSFDGKNLTTVWGENTPNNNAVFVRESNDSGKTFATKVLVGNNDSLVSDPKIATDGEDVIIVSTVNDNLTNQDIIINRSNDSGKTFEETNLTENATNKEVARVDIIAPATALPNQNVNLKVETIGLNGTISYSYNVSGPQTLVIPSSEGNQSANITLRMPASCLKPENEEYSVNVTAMNPTKSQATGLTKLLMECIGVNHPPLANSSSYVTELGSNVTIDLRQITSDMDNDSLSANVTSEPFYGV